MKLFWFFLAPHSKGYPADNVNILTCKHKGGNKPQGRIAHIGRLHSSSSSPVPSCRLVPMPQAYTEPGGSSQQLEPQTYTVPSSVSAAVWLSPADTWTTFSDNAQLSDIPLAKNKNLTWVLAMTPEVLGCNSCREAASMAPCQTIPPHGQHAKESEYAHQCAGVRLYLVSAEPICVRMASHCSRLCQVRPVCRGGWSSLPLLSWMKRSLSGAQGRLLSFRASVSFLLTLLARAPG
ncbi:hypothetical protein EYF80_013560 [Liparis tanakae]|uniref:Uncharacterized protein n=1 Tax=Liparis tanakae TaxID=230148 RepID=A0A4Z2IG47_9TELE|nr:hypothetical protein EYF80_013560 [Liparis tanakae]